MILYSTWGRWSYSVFIFFFVIYLILVIIIILVIHMFLQLFISFRIFIFRGNIGLFNGRSNLSRGNIFRRFFQWRLMDTICNFSKTEIYSSTGRRLKAKRKKRTTKQSQSYINETAKQKKAILITRVF